MPPPTRAEGADVAEVAAAVATAVTIGATTGEPAADAETTEVEPAETVAVAEGLVAVGADKPTVLADVAAARAEQSKHSSLPANNRVFRKFR